MLTYLGRNLILIFFLDFLILKIASFLPIFKGIYEGS